MHAIFRQVMANLRGHRLQTRLIFLTLLAAATLLTLALSTFRTAQGAYDRLFERIHGAHLWLELNPARVSAAAAEEALAGLPGVQGSTGATTYLFARLMVGQAPQEIRLGEWPDDLVAVSRPLLMVGKAPQPDERDALALDRNFAAESHLSVGDMVRLLTPAGWQPMTVSGLFVTDRFPPYPSYGPPLAYVAPGTRAGLGLYPPLSLETVELVVGLRLQDPPDPQAVREAAADALPAESVISRYDWLDTRRLCESNVHPQRILLLTFSLVAGLAAGFIIANAIGGAVRAQTRQIGLLKAVGFTGWQLATVYLAGYVGLALAASLAGLVAGSLLTPLILRSLTAQFGEVLAFPPLWAILATPLGTLLVAALFTLWPVRRAVRLNAVDAIRVGA
ncbi:MAG: FtsX-like permease family protein, partial [Anaerolineae bacterium]